MERDCICVVVEITARQASALARLEHRHRDALARWESRRLAASEPRDEAP